jgi:hypothetical protein
MIKNKGVYLYGVCTEKSALLPIVTMSGAIAYCLSKANEERLAPTYIMVDNDLIYLISTSMDGLTFASVYEALYCLNINGEIDSIENDKLKSAITFLYDFMKSKRQPSIVPINASIGWKYCLGPSIGVKEIEYENTDDYTHVLRYDGNIKPTMIAPSEQYKNMLYYKDIISDTEVDGLSNLKLSVYNTYSKSEFEPLYPSINYASIKKIRSFDYSIVPDVKVSDYDSQIKLLNDVEYSWFNDGLSLFISPSLTATYLNKLDKETGKYESLDSIAYKVIQSYYKLNDDKKIRYILSLYNISNSWEYESEYNVDDYIYTITFEMK